MDDGTWNTIPSRRRKRPAPDMQQLQTKMNIDGLAWTLLTYEELYRDPNYKLLGVYMPAKSTMKYVPTSAAGSDLPYEDANAADPNECRDWLVRDVVNNKYGDQVVFVPSHSPEFLDDATEAESAEMADAYVNGMPKNTTG